jgi:hypothetical protein
MAATIWTANDLLRKRPRGSDSTADRLYDDLSSLRFHHNKQSGDCQPALPLVEYIEPSGDRQRPLPSTLGKISASTGSVSPSRERLTLLLDDYMLKAEKYFKAGSYANCKKFLLKAIENADCRYEMYGQVFDPWLDIQIKVANVLQLQAKYEDAGKLLSDLIASAHHYVLPDHRRITPVRLGKLHHAIACLYLRRYYVIGNIQPSAVYTMAEKAYYFASNLHLGDSEPLSSERLLIQCASTFHEACELVGKTVPAYALRDRHPAVTFGDATAKNGEPGELGFMPSTNDQNLFPTEPSTALWATQKVTGTVYPDISNIYNMDATAKNGKPSELGFMPSTNDQNLFPTEPSTALWATQKVTGTVYPDISNIYNMDATAKNGKPSELGFMPSTNDQNLFPTEPSTALWATQEATGTVYPDISNLYNMQFESYISELSSDLFNNVSHLGPDIQTLEKIFEVLADRLKAFALRIGQHAPSQVHRDIMVFVYKYRK